MECGRARVYKIDKLFCVLRVHTLKYTEMQRTGKGGGTDKNAADALRSNITALFQYRVPKTARTS